MLLIDLFIAFFVIVALAVSWLVMNLVFGNDVQVKTAGHHETIHTAVAQAVPEKHVENPAPAARTKQPRKRSGLTCRDEMVSAAQDLTKEKGINEFAAKELVEYLVNQGTAYSVGTIRSQLSSHSQPGAAAKNGDRRDEFERISRGIYRLVS